MEAFVSAQCGELPEMTGVPGCSEPPRLHQRIVLEHAHPRIFDHRWTPLRPEISLRNTWNRRLGTGVVAMSNLGVVSRLFVWDSRSFAWQL